MEITAFLKASQIPFLPIWYHISDVDGKKIPHYEKNDATMEEIELRRPIAKGRIQTLPLNTWKKVGKKYVADHILTDTETASLKRAFSFYIKHCPDMYCIDVDEYDIHNMEEFIAKTGITLFQDCAWIEGNMKGIHIYAKVLNMIEYSNQQNVYELWKGDFLRKNNVWERTGKKVHNGGRIIEIEYEDMKMLFNDKINDTEKPKIKVKKPTQKVNLVLAEAELVNDVLENYEEPELDDDEPILPIATAIDEATKTECKLYFETGLKYKIFGKMTDSTKQTGHQIWCNLGYISQNNLPENEAETTFCELSKQYCEATGKDYDEEAVKKVFESLKITADKKNKIKIGSLVKYFKDTDPELAKTIIKEVKSLLNPKKVKEQKVVASLYEAVSEPIVFKENVLEHFNTKYMNSMDKDYSNQKRYFETFVSKVMRPEPLYIYIEGGQNIGTESCLFTEKNIIQTFRHCRTWKNTLLGPVLSPFTSTWLDDPKIQVYNRLDFIPFNGTEGKQESKSVYNLFTGYNSSIHTTYNVEKKDVILKPFLDLLLELSGGVVAHRDYFLKFISHMVQKPNERIPICFIFKGKQGTGKNVMLNAIGSIVGKEHYITSSNPKDFFGEHAEGFYHKLLVNMNECEGKDTFDFEGKIKSFISEDTIGINPKYVRPTIIRNVARVIIFTNKPNPIPIDVKSSDRRYVVYQTTDVFLDKKYGTKFWTNLVAHFAKPEFIACLYDYFNTMDINIDWRTERPITQAYKDMCKLHIPCEALFLEHLVETINNCGWYIEKLNDTKLIKDITMEIHPLAKQMYKEYEDFCKGNGFWNEKSFQPSIQKFIARMTELEIPFLEIKSNGYNEFRFTPADVKAHLLKRKWICREEDDPEIVIEDLVGEDFVFEI